MSVDLLAGRVGLHTDLRRITGCEVLEDGEALSRYSTDFGQIIRKIPTAVVRVGSAEAIRRVIIYATANGIPISTRGAGCSLSGQSLSEGGVIVDMSGLSQVHEVQTDELWFVADAGATWGSVITATAPLGVLPPVLPGYVHVSMGGTLSTVGWGAASFRDGPQIANCLALEIVTGNGEIVCCSAEENSELFSCALGGLGQFGVITKIRHRLRRFRPALRTYSLAYPNLDSLADDYDRVVAAGHTAYVDGHITREVWGGEPGPWQYLLNISIEAERLEDISDESILADLKFPRENWLSNSSTVEYLTSIAKVEPDSGVAQPWVVIFLPRSKARNYIEFCLANLPFPNLGGRGAVMRIWLGSRRNSIMPMLQLPEEDDFLLFALFASVPRPHLSAAVSLLSRAADLGVRLGGKLHLGTCLPSDAARWRLHFGDSWKCVTALKKRYDPAGIFNPGMIAFEPDDLIVLPSIPDRSR